MKATQPASAIISLPGVEITAREVAERMVADGEQSWKLWLFELVDGFRRNPDLHLVKAAPEAALTPRSRCLLAATIESLCAEHGLQPPGWCGKIGALPMPWFVSETENLKATALVESPARFRSRNIFVLNNFLARA